MIRGTVLGEVWATKKHERLRGAKLILVAVSKMTTDGWRPSGRVIVVRDSLSALRGQSVIVAFGSGARRTLKTAPNYGVLADAATIQIVDGSQESTRVPPKPPPTSAREDSEIGDVSPQPMKKSEEVS